jgi:mRNA interferase RelE/StbE
VSQYSVYVTPSALSEVKDLPGHVRQRVKRAIDDLAANPHPPGSKTLDLSDSEILPITEAEKTVDVLAVRKRPPYDYGDLEELLKGVE